MNALRRSLVFLLAVSGLFLLSGTARAEVINVTTTTDQFAGTSGCSLRDAFNGAVYGGSLGDCEMSGADDTIKLPAGTYQLTVGTAGDGTPNSGDLDFAGPDAVTIEPQGPADKVVIDGTGLDRVFDHVGGSIGDLFLRDLTITGGNTGAGAGFDGGAVRVADGLVRAEGVTFFGNTAGDNGGAIWVANGASFEAINSTFSQNRAAVDGGAISLGNVGAFADLRSVTISENRADDDTDGLGDGGGLDGGIGNSTVMMLNSILAGNQDGSPSPADQVPDCISNSNFLPRYVISTQQFGAGECFATLPAPESNQAPVDPLLEGFGDNGGPTATYSIAPASPAVNGGGTAFPDQCPATDQRGIARPDGACDIGAFEYVAPPVDPPPVDPDPEPLPGLVAPTVDTATFDGTSLYVRLRCPGRFRPRCRSVAVPVTRATGGRPMAAARRVVVRSKRWKVVSFRIKAAYRATVAAMTYLDRRQLVVRQRIRSKRIWKRGAPRKPATVFHKYKVRVKS